MKKLSEDQLENLLRDMPKLKDHRDPHAIFENISKKVEERPRKSWVIPSFATAAAVCIVAILSFNLLNGVNTNHSAEEGVRESTEHQDTELKREDASAEKEERVDVGHEESTSEMNDSTFQSVEEPTAAVYPEDLGAMQVFTLAIPDAQAQNIIPVSFLVEPSNSTETLARVEELMEEINEKELGVADFYPLQAELSIDNNALRVNVAADHPYQDGTSGLVFVNVINQMLVTLQLDRAVFTTNETEEGMSTGHDMITEKLKEELKNRAYYLFYPNDETPKSFLVPFTQTYQSIEEALQGMKSDIETHQLTAPILVDQIEAVTTDKTNKLVTITFRKDMKMEDNPVTLQSIEAILLTAKSFQFEKVRFENAPIDSIGRFQLQEEIEVPVAANKELVD